MADESPFRFPAQGFVLEPQLILKAGEKWYDEPLSSDLAIAQQLECKPFWANIRQRKQHLPADVSDFARFKEVHYIIAEAWTDSIIKDRWPLENFLQRFTKESNRRFSDNRVVLHVPQILNKDQTNAFSAIFKPLEKLRGKVTIVADDLAWVTCLWPNARKEWKLSVNGNERFRKREVLRDFDRGAMVTAIILSFLKVLLLLLTLQVPYERLLRGICCPSFS